MSEHTRLALTNIELTEDGIFIRSVEVIDSISGERLRPCKLTQELANFLKILEIDTDAFFQVQELQKKNPTITKLIDTFKLYT
jgi:hypothetical protein